MARKRKRFLADQLEESATARHRPRRKLHHVAEEYHDTGRIADGWNLVRHLRPRYQFAVIGTTKGGPDRVQAIAHG